jgi:hypothetical protein
MEKAAVVMVEKSRQDRCFFLVDDPSAHVESHHANVLPACVSHTKQSTLNVLGTDEFVATPMHNEDGSRQTQRYLLCYPTLSFHSTMRSMQVPSSR